MHSLFFYKSTRLEKIIRIQWIKLCKHALTLMNY